MKQIIETFSDYSTELNLDVISKLPIKERSKSAIMDVSKSYLRYLNSNELQFNEDSIISYLTQTEQDGKEISPATRNNRKCLLKRIVLAQPIFINDLLKKAMIEEVFKRVKSYQVNNKVSEDAYLSENEIQQLLDSCKNGSKRKYKTGLIIESLIQSGCRISELINIRLENCTPNGHASIEVIGKGNKVRTVYIKKELFDEIRKVFDGKKWLFESENGSTLFRNNILIKIKRAVKNSGILKNIGCHSMRHTTAMTLKEKGLSLKEIGTYLGHSSSITTLNFYDHSMPTATNILD